MMIEELDPCNSRLFLLTSKERIRVHEITTPRESTVKAELLLFHREKFWWHICWFKENISKNTLWTNIQHISHMYFVGCCINLIPSGRAKKRKGIPDVSKGLNLLWFYDLSYPREIVLERESAFWLLDLTRYQLYAIYDTTQNRVCFDW